MWLDFDNYVVYAKLIENLYLLRALQVANFGDLLICPKVKYF